MGFRFRRSVKIAPGVRLNFSKSGVSTSLGPRGAKITIGHGQVRETVGIPGTGISYTETHRESQGGSASGPGVLDQGVKVTPAVFIFIVLTVILLVYLLS